MQDLVYTNSPSPPDSPEPYFDTGQSRQHPLCPYVAQNNIFLGACDGRGRPQKLVAKVIRVLDCTFSSVMLVEAHSPALDLSGRYVLKMFDRRFAEGLRTDAELDQWVYSVEDDYISFVSENQLEHEQLFDYDPSMKSDRYDDRSIYAMRSTPWDKAHEITAAEMEVEVQSDCLNYFAAEVETYTRLKPYQGRFVPTLRGIVWLKGSERTGDSSSYLHCPGILLDYIEGFNMIDLARYAPPDKWGAVIDRANDIIEIIREHNMCNEDAHARSFIVRDYDGPDGPDMVMIDFGHCQFRGPELSDTDWDKNQQCADELHQVQSEIERALTAGTSLFNEPARAERLLSKPLMSERELYLAEEYGEMWR